MASLASLQSDGGYLGLDIQAFFSAVVTSAPGMFAAMLLQDAGIETDVVVRSGQRVSVRGDASRSRPPRWGNGGFTVQQHGYLSLSSMAISRVSMCGGELSLVQMDVAIDVLGELLVQMLLLVNTTAGGVIRLSEVTVPDSWQDLKGLTGSMTMGADGALVYDPPNLLPGHEVRIAARIHQFSLQHDVWHSWLFRPR